MRNQRRCLSSLLSLLLLLNYFCSCFGREDQAGFSSVFSRNAVLQRGPERALLFGYVGDKTEWVSVTIRGSKEPFLKPISVRSQILEDGNTWRAVLPPGPEDGGGRFEIVMNSNSGSQVLENVTFGDVFVCSGQSNMALGVKWTFSAPDVTEILQNSEDIFVFDFAGMASGHRESPIPRYALSRDESISKGWHRATNYNVAEFSSTCLYFGIQLHLRSKELRVPLGLVHSSVGGTEIEFWMPEEGVRKCASLAFQPSGLFNGLIAPFVNMSIAGVIWYQGENDVYHLVGTNPEKSSYACRLRALISSWRQLWGLPQLFFGIVSLAGGGDEGHAQNMAQFRAQQMEVADGLENVFLAHAFDMNDPWFNFNACKNAKCCPEKPGFNTSFLPAEGCWKSRTRWQQEIDGDWFHNSAPWFMGPIHPRIKRRLGDRLALTFLEFKGLVRPLRLRAKGALLNIERKMLIVKTNTRNELEIVKSGIPDSAVEICVGDETTCKCKSWNFKRKPDDSSQWFCSVPSKANLEWRPHPNPADKSWISIPKEKLSISPQGYIEIDVGHLPRVRSVRYAWSTLPCCDKAFKPIQNGTVPCFLNCPFMSKEFQLPLDPFFLEIPPNTLISEAI